MKLRILFYLFFLVHLHRVALEVNLTRLMTYQLTLCGPAFFCNVSKWNFPYLDSKTNYNHTLCPPCFCDSSCFSRGDCCPDKYFETDGLTCFNVTSINATTDISRDQRTQYLMITKCPSNTGRTLKDNCEIESESVLKLKFPPVTSLVTNITYVNKYCARCHDEQSTMHWSLDIFCRLFLDINFLSSFEEVFTKGLERKCIMQSVPPAASSYYNCYRVLEHKLGSCNETGFWKEKDQDILDACHSYYVNNNTLFKNMFCKICNPTFYDGEIITECNITGKWDFFDSNLKEACSFYGYNAGILPYKNIFCRKCNAPESLLHEYLDAVANTSIEILYSKEGKTTYHYNVNFRGFPEEHFKFVHKTHHEKHDFVKRPEIYINKTHTLNVTELIHKSIAIKKFAKVCEDHNIPNAISGILRQCSCTPSCFAHWNCCEDFALRYPSACLIEKYLSGEKYKQRTNIEYLVTNGCYMQNVYQRYLEEGCHERMPNDIFSVHPVLDIKTNISYLNMYCYLCNMPRFNFIPSSSKPWDIEIYCSVFIDFKSFLTMANLLDTIKRSRCNVTYLPLEKGDLPHNVAYCLKTDTMYNGICNSSGKWFVHDDHVRYACEKIAFGALSEFYRLRLKPRCEHPYKNVYCALCNPEHTENITIKDCNVTGDAPAFDELTLTACNFFPEVNVYPPYKNLFCRDCNIGKQGAACAGQSKFLPEVFWTDSLQWLPIYRNLFSCTELKKTLSLRKHSICNSAQIYDSLSDQCRNITCYPGKFYTNGKCVALFPETKNLGYILIASFKGNVSSIFPVKKLLQTIHHTVKNNTIHDLMIQHTDPLEEVIIQIDQPCLTKEQSLSFLNFTGSIALKMFISERVPRIETEERLITIISRSSMAKLRNSLIHLSFTSKNHRHNHFHLLQKSVTENSSRCSLHITKTNPSNPLRNQYLNVRVSKLLTCSQVEFAVDEYSIDEHFGDLVLSESRKSYGYDSFDIFPNGSARVCITDFETKESFIVKEEKNGILLSKLIFILNVVSIVFLILAFFVHIFIKELQTLPGKNNMILVLSLALSLVIFQLSDIGMLNTMFCTGIGVVLHYFWLMAFSSMATCCYHMFKMFYSSGLILEDKNRTFKMYITLIIMCPAFIVTLNVLILFSIYNNGYIGYGVQKCFIDNLISRILSFILPVSIMCVTNTLFFIGTIISIKKVPDVPGNKSMRNEFLIFSRLFTITGITWSLQVIDGFIHFTIFTYVSSVINSLQGIAIFAAFICNKRVYTLLREIYRQKTRSLGRIQENTESNSEKCSEITKL